MTSSQARQILAEWSDRPSWPGSETLDVFRRARARAHPDRNRGDRAAWDQVEQAAKVLGVLR